MWHAWLIKSSQKTFLGMPIEKAPLGGIMRTRHDSINLDLKEMG